MSDFELDIEMLISLMESRPMLWDKTDDIFKDRNVTKKAWRKWVLVLKKTLKYQDVFTTTIQKQHNNNRTTVQSRSLRTHGYLVTVLALSTGR
jgi:hypothetical protein